MALLVQQATGEWAKVATTETAGVHTIQATPLPSNAFLVFMQPNGEFIRVATVLAGGEHIIAVEVTP